jgi:hypothetical protein
MSIEGPADANHEPDAPLPYTDSTAVERAEIGDAEYMVRIEQQAADESAPRDVTPTDAERMEYTERAAASETSSDAEPESALDKAETTGRPDDSEEPKEAADTDSEAGQPDSTTARRDATVADVLRRTLHRVADLAAGRRGCPAGSGTSRRQGISRIAPRIP